MIDNHDAYPWRAYKIKTSYRERDLPARIDIQVEDQLGMVSRILGPIEEIAPRIFSLESRED